MRPIPHMSENIVEWICQSLQEGDEKKILIEYGSGGSTLFFIDYLLENKIDAAYVAVERSYRWYLSLQKEIEEKFREKVAGKKKDRVFWSMAKYLQFVTSTNRTVLDIPDEIKMLPEFQSKARRMLGRYLALRLDQCLRLSKNPKQVGAGKRMIDKIALKMARNHGKAPFFDATTYYQLCDAIDFHLEFRLELFKDQHGESPTKKEYILAGTQPIEKKLEEGRRFKAIVLIDGGPRGDIVSEILNMEERWPQLKIEIFLLDAQQNCYRQVISRRKKGIFVKGTNRLLNGKDVYQKPDTRKIDAATRKRIEYNMGKTDLEVSDFSGRELWYYKKG